MLKKHTLTQVRAEADEASAEGRRERKKRRIRSYFEVAAKGLQDETNSFGTRVSPPPRHILFQYFILFTESASFADWSAEKDRQQAVIDTGLDIPSSMLGYSRLARHSRQPLLHLSPMPFNSSPPPIYTALRPRRRRVDALYARASASTPSRSPTRAYPLRYSSQTLKYRKGREANIKGIQHGQKKMIQARLRCRRGEIP